MYLHVFMCSDMNKKEMFCKADLSKLAVGLFLIDAKFNYNAERFFGFAQVDLYYEQRTNEEVSEFIIFDRFKCGLSLLIFRVNIAAPFNKQLKQ